MKKIFANFPYNLLVYLLDIWYIKKGDIVYKEGNESTHGFILKNGDFSV